MTPDLRTIPQVLDRIADQFLITTPWSPPPAVGDPAGDRRLTYGQLRTEVRQAAAAMIDLGVVAGDRVAIWSPNTWHWVVACLATHYAGGVVVPLNTRYTASEATDILSRTGAPLLFAAGEFLGADKAASIDRERPAGPAARHPHPDREERRHMGRVRRPRHRPRCRRRPRGSRHRRRCVRHPLHVRHHRAQQGRVVRTSSVTRRPCGVGGVRAAHQRRPLPVHQPVLPQLRLQGRHPGLPADRRDADPPADVRPREGHGSGAGTPHHRVAWAAHDLPDTVGPSQARRVRPDIAAVRRHRRGDDPGGPDRTHADRTRHRHRAHRLRPDRGQRVRHHVPRRRRRGHRRHDLRAPDRRLRVAHRRPRREDGSGEVLLRGPNVMLGYLDDAEATAAAIDSEGWLHTGDVGQLDDSGNLHDHRPAQGHVHLRRVQRLSRRDRAGARTDSTAWPRPR